MNITLGLRTLLLLAFVAAATAVLVRPGLVDAGSGAGNSAATHAMLMLVRN